MNYNYTFPNADTALPQLLAHLLEDGEEVGSRGGSRTMEQTMVGITLQQPWQRELLHPLRKANIAAQIAETMWVLGGRNDVEFLSHYLPRAEQFSDDGEVWRGGYGPRLRRWLRPNEDVFEDGLVTDQLAEVINLFEDDMTTRRAVMSIFDPRLDFTDSKDIPCNNWLSFISRLGKLDLHVAIRSNDVMWGWSGINQFEWSALQEIVAGLLGLQVGNLHFSTTSFHLYDRHWKKAGEIANGAVNPTSQLADSPRFDPSERTVEYFDDLVREWFLLEDLIRNSNDTSMLAELDSQIHDFPEPMLRSWLRILRWWWTGQDVYLKPLDGTRLWDAARQSVQPKRNEIIGFVMESVPAGAPVTVMQSGQVHTLGGHFERVPDHTPFILETVKLHDEKHAAYGDSWKRRGQMLGILANIARKVDRLGGAETSDETSADTAADLLVYLAKYRSWLSDQLNGTNESDTTAHANRILLGLDAPNHHVEQIAERTDGSIADHIRGQFENLEGLVNQKEDVTWLVDSMMEYAYVLAKRLHWKQANATRSWDPEPVADNETSPYRAVTDSQLESLLALVGVKVNSYNYADWTTEQRAAAAKWASMVHLDASDNDVIVPERPSFLPAEGNRRPIPDNPQG